LPADGSTDNAAAIQKAVSAAAAAGGGTVLVPAASKAYECGPITLPSHIRLEVDKGATLQILAYAKYPLSGSSYANWLNIKNANNVEISGRGIIDGQGQAWWDAYNANNSMPHRPYMIDFSGCNTVRVHQITLTNSPMFHLAVNADSLTIDSVTIIAPSTAPNTDGIDPSGREVLIRDDSISTGDDNIAIKAGSAYCKNFFISGCGFGTGHGLSVGGQSNDGLDSLSVTNCRFTGTTNGIRLKANRTNGGLSQHMLYTDIAMSNVQYPIYITSYYGNSSPSTTDPDSVITSLTPIWKDAVIANLTSKNTSSSSTAGFLWGLPEMPLDSITLANVNISAPKNMVVTHAKNLKILNSTLSPSTITTSDASPAVSSPGFALVSAPWPRTDSVGDTARFEVVATGTSTLSHQWMKDSKTLSNDTRISGATSSILVISGLVPGDAGSYTVAASNSSGSGTSAAAKLVVLGTSTTSLAQKAIPPGRNTGRTPGHPWASRRQGCPFLDRVRSLDGMGAPRAGDVTFFLDAPPNLRRERGSRR
jgi:polygalacturonase